MTEVLLKRLPAKVLIALNSGSVNMAKLMSAIGTKYYSSISGLLRKLEKEGIVVIRTEGAEKFISLTEKGTEIAERITKVDQLLKEQLPSETRP